MLLKGGINMFEEEKISDRQFVDNPYVDPVDFCCMEDEDVKKQNGGWRIHRKFNSARILHDDELIGFTEGKYYCGSIVSTRLNRVTKAETGEKIYYLNIGYEIFMDDNGLLRLYDSMSCNFTRCSKLTRFLCNLGFNVSAMSYFQPECLVGLPIKLCLGLVDGKRKVIEVVPNNVKVLE